MKSLLPVVFLMFIMSIFFSIAIAQENTPYEGVISGDRVHIRAGSGTAHKSLTKLNKGDKVVIVSKKEISGEIWFEIEIPKDVFLFISQRYVEKKEEKGDALIGVIKTEEDGGLVSIRTGVEADDVVIGTVKNGDTVRIRGTKDGWYNILPPKGFTAWVHGDYVTAVNNQETPPKNPPDIQPNDDKQDLQKKLEELEEQMRKLKEVPG
ncbi:MAG: SH3 domain-containing protein, partial [Planctomycetota bacterium]